jgi:hypothetical protein
MNPHVARYETVACIDTFVADVHGGNHRWCEHFGNEQDRISFFRSASRCNASFGRVVEAHYDAQSILVEAQVPVPEDKVLAVWASTGRSTLVAKQVGERLMLNGVQKFCGGAHVSDLALLVVQLRDGEQLLKVELSDPGVSIDLESWKLAAFRDTGIATVSFDNVSVPSSVFIGPVNFYGNRQGFWLGAIRVAAGWAGLVDRIIDQLPESPCTESYVRVQNGRIEAWMWAIDAALGEAGRVIDGGEFFDPKRVALCVRQVVVDAALNILAAVESRRGPAALAFDEQWNTACTELRLALGQHHGDRDLLELADVVADNSQFDVS